jgi:hypothetical protein
VAGCRAESVALQRPAQRDGTRVAEAVAPEVKVRQRPVRVLHDGVGERYRACTHTHTRGAAVQQTQQCWASLTDTRPGDARPQPTRTPPRKPRKHEGNPYVTHRDRWHGPLTRVR